MNEAGLAPGTAIRLQQENPKRAGAKAHDRYQKYKKAKTVEEALGLGAYKGDLLFDLKAGFLTLVNDSSGAKSQSSGSGSGSGSGASAAPGKGVAAAAASSSSTASTSKVKKERKLKKKLGVAKAAAATKKQPPKAKGKATSKAKVEAEEQDSTAEPKAVKVIHKVRKISDDEMGYRLFKTKERYVVLDNVYRRVMIELPISHVKDTEKDKQKRQSRIEKELKAKWDKLNRPARKKFITEAKKKREKELEKAKKRAERGPAFSTFSRALCIKLKNVRAKDLPTMRTSMEWKFPKHPPKHASPPPPGELKVPTSSDASCR
jgi:hypothetical protein